MTALLFESFAGSSGALANPPFTQQETATVNRDGSSHGKASAVDAAHDLCAFDNTNAYPGTQYAQMTIVSGLSNANNYAIIMVRCSGTGGSKNNYYLATDGVNGTTHTAIGKYVANVQTELLALSPATAFASGHRMCLGVSPDFLLTAYQDTGSGVFVPIGSISDPAKALATGSPGLGMFNGAANNVLVSLFEAGILDAPRLVRRMAPTQRMLA